MTLNHISKLANQAKGRGIKEGGIEELSVKRSCNEIIGNHAPASLKLMDIAKIFVSSDDLIVAQTYCSFGDNDNDDRDKANRDKANRDKANRDKATQELADRLPSYGDFNLGLHVGDQPSQVHRRRGQLLAALNAHIQQNTHQASSITQLHWVNQVHGNHVIDVDAQPLSLSAQDADAMISQSAQCALAIMTADCVPIVLYQPASGQIGAIHAGWQGLANGIIAATVKRFNPSMPIYAWIGACISQANYQVSTEVASKLVESCLSLGLVNALSFKLLYQQITDDTVAQSGQTLAQQPSAKTQLDLRKLTRLQLDHLGINLAADEQIACSYGDRRYYSYRQQTHEGRPATGRMAMIIAKR